jgi:outer membrane cobalamin receptor
MTLIERIEHASGAFATAAASAALGGVIWLIRRIFTNQKQIEMLQREIEIRDLRRQEDREALGQVRDDVREMRQEIRDIFQRK